MTDRRDEAYLGEARERVARRVRRELERGSRVGRLDHGNAEPQQTRQGFTRVHARLTPSSSSRMTTVCRIAFHASALPDDSACEGSRYATT